MFVKIRDGHLEETSFANNAPAINNQVAIVRRDINTEEERIFRCENVAHISQNEQNARYRLAKAASRKEGPRNEVCLACPPKRKADSLFTPSSRVATREQATAQVLRYSNIAVDVCISRRTRAIPIHSVCCAAYIYEYLHNTHVNGSRRASRVLALLPKSRWEFCDAAIAPEQFETSEGKSGSRHIARAQHLLRVVVHTRTRSHHIASRLPSSFATRLPASSVRLRHRSTRFVVGKRRRLACSKKK